MPGRSTRDTIFIACQLQEKCHLFNEPETAVDHISQKTIKQVLHPREAVEHVICLLMAMDCKTRTIIRHNGGEIRRFNINVDVHARTILSQLLFILVTKEVKQTTKTNSPWEIFHMDNSKSTNDLKEKFVNKVKKTGRLLAERKQ